MFGFDCITPRQPVSHAKIYSTYGRFFGALLAGQRDLQLQTALVTSSESDLPNNLEFLKAFTRRLMMELNEETSQNRRFARFSSRLAKKLVCLGQLSSNELRTSFNLGLRIEVSNINWLLNGSPWNTTREVSTSTDSFFLEDEADSSRSLTQDQATETDQSYCEDLGTLEMETLNQSKTASEDSTLSESPVLPSYELGQPSELSVSSVPSAPLRYAYPQHLHLPPGKAARFNYPYRAPSTESGFNVGIPESLIILHKDTDFMYKKSSCSCCNPVLTPLGGYNENDAFTEVAYPEDEPKYFDREVVSGDRAPFYSSTAFDFDLDSPSTDRYGTRTYELEPDEEGLETILVMPDSDPLTHYEERINTVEHIHDQLKAELEGALRSAVDISEMASYIANAVSHDRGERSLMKLQAMEEFKPRPTKQTQPRAGGGAQLKSKIPILMSKFNRKPGSAGTSGAPIGDTPSGEPKSETDIQKVPEISSYRRKMAKTPRTTAKRWVGASK